MKIFLEHFFNILDWAYGLLPVRVRVSAHYAIHVCHSNHAHRPAKWWQRYTNGWLDRDDDDDDDDDDGNDDDDYDNEEYDDGNDYDNEDDEITEITACQQWTSSQAKAKWAHGGSQKTTKTVGTCKNQHSSLWSAFRSLSAFHGPSPVWSAAFRTRRSWIARAWSCGNPANAKAPLQNLREKQNEKWRVEQENAKSPEKEMEKTQQTFVFSLSSAMSTLRLLSTYLLSD